MSLAGEPPAAAPERCARLKHLPGEPSAELPDGEPRALQPLGAHHPLYLVDRVVRATPWPPAPGRPEPVAEAEEPLPDPDRLLRALLLQVLYGIACNRQLLEQLRYDLRFRWFAGLAAQDLPWSEAAHLQARAALLQPITRRHAFGELLRQLRPIARTWPEHFVCDERLADPWLSEAGTRPRHPATRTAAGTSALLQAAGLDAAGTNGDERLLQALETILTRIAEPRLNSDWLAAELGMSRRSLYYLFDAHGITPATAIRNIRLAHSRQLLEDQGNRRRKIAEIALDLGFANVYTFSRGFKRRYGIDPSDCRSGRPD